MGIEKLTSDKMSNSWQGCFYLKKKLIQVKAYVKTKYLNIKDFKNKTKNIFKDKMKSMKIAICDNYCKIFFALATLMIIIFSFKINNKMNKESEIQTGIKRTSDSIMMKVSESEHDKVLYLENIYRDIVNSPKDSLMLEIKRNLNNIYWRVTRIENIIERDTIK